MIRAHEESDTKSKRVRDAIRRRCKGWTEGTYRGLIRCGKTPGWLRVIEGKWELITERTRSHRVAVDMFRRGLGTGHIAKSLHWAATSTAAPTPRKNVAFSLKKVIVLSRSAERASSFVLSVLAVPPELLAAKTAVAHRWLNLVHCVCPLQQKAIEDAICIFVTLVF
jgi:hypothetical protein